MEKTRVVLAIASDDKRTLSRLGLEVSGGFDVVGVATDLHDVESVVASARPDVVLIDFSDTTSGDLSALPLVRRALPTAIPVLYQALAARRAATGGSTGRDPSPAELARLLSSLLAHTRVPRPVVIRGARRAGELTKGEHAVAM